ncbi:MAG TPA: LacI family DNA-binding transcriptional regulator, partial [Humibacter sp.]|nr:LacI family DNA-binding transcriptional regulator [Humibacter sp.]
MASRSTLAELADNLGLSVNTVSRALTGKDGVSGRTRDLVREEAARIGYVTRRSFDPTARTSRVIALTIPSPTHTFSAELLAAIETGTRAAGYSLDLFTTEESELEEDDIAGTIAEADVAGAIVIPVQGADAPWTRVRAAGVPLVVVSRALDDLEADFVGVDSEAGEYAAVRHLLNQGCRSLVFLEEDLQISTIEERRRGFDAALAEHPGASGQRVLVPTRRFESGRTNWRAQEAYRAFLDVLDRGVEPDGVTTGDDDFALGVMRALADR